MGAGVKNRSDSEALRQPVWNALHTTHRHFALRTPLALKYPAAVTPFAALSENSEEAVSQLAGLLEPGEITYIHGDPPPAVPGLRVLDPLPVLQLIYPAGAPIPGTGDQAGFEIVPLTWAHAPDMVALTDVAFPGYFRFRTCEMGTYYGVWHSGQLIAMAGERLCLNPLREVSGVCTHPAWRGRGLASRLMARVMQDHRRDGHTSWLHVVSTNRVAIDIYLRMGFELIRETHLHGIQLT